MNIIKTGAKLSRGPSCPVTIINGYISDMECTDLFSVFDLTYHIIIMMYVYVHIIETICIRTATLQNWSCKSTSNNK